MKRLYHIVLLMLCCALVGSVVACRASSGSEYVYEPQPGPPEGLFAAPEQAYWSEEGGFAPDAARMITALSFQYCLERYYAQNGTYPATLAELIPDFAPQGEDGQPIMSVGSNQWASQLAYRCDAGGQSCLLSVVLDSGQAYELAVGGE